MTCKNCGKEIRKSSLASFWGHVHLKPNTFRCDGVATTGVNVDRTKKLVEPLLPPDILKSIKKHLYGL